MKFKKSLHVFMASIFLFAAMQGVTYANGNIAVVDKAALNHDFSLGFDDTPYLVTEGTTEQIYNEFRDSIPEEMEQFDPYIPEGKHQIFVSVDGSDKNPGTIEKPVKTLQAAVDRLAALPNRVGGAVIYFREGSHSIDKTVVIPSTLSGNEEHPLFISNYGDEEVKLYAAKTKTSKPQTVTDDPLAIEKFNSSIIDKIRKIDCSDMNINYEVDSTAEIKVQIGGIDYNMSRWPNYGYTNIANYTGEDGEHGVISTGDVRTGASGLLPTPTFTKPFEFVMSTHRPLTWENTGDIWIYGRMNSEWLWARHNVDSFNPDIPSLKSKTPGHEGCKYVGNHNVYYFYNVIEELDCAGEYFYHKESRTLYFYPISDCDDADVEVLIPSTLDTMITVNAAKNVVFNGIEFGYGANNAIKIISDMNVVQNCTFKNLKDYAVKIIGKNNGVIYSEFLYNGGLINIHSNDNDGAQRLSTRATRTELTRNFVQNNYFQSAYGGDNEVLMNYNVQSVISHNMFNCDSNLTLLEGNRHCVIENNKFISFKLYVDDYGAIYNAGHFLQTNNTYRANYFRRYITDDVENASHGIYLDDIGVTAMIYNNIFVDCDLYYHGGSDHAADNNIFIGIDNEDEIAYKTSMNFWINTGSVAPVMEKHIDEYPRNLKGERSTWNTLNDTFSMWDYRVNELFANYRRVRSERNLKGDSYVRNETEDLIRSQRNNLLINNVFFRRPAPQILESDYNPCYRDNLVITQDPGFKDLSGYNFDLKADSVVFEKLPGFKALPAMDTMGITFGKGIFTDKLRVESAKCVSPADTTETIVTNKQLKIDWTDSLGASEYILKVSENPDFSNLIINKSLGGVFSEYTMPDLRFDTVYYWQVETKANDDSFDTDSVKSQVFSFKTCKQKDAYLFEELNIDVIKNVVRDIRANMIYITEDTGKDVGYGVYQKGTISKLEALIVQAEEKYNSYKLQDEVDGAAEKLYKDYMDILMENAIPYTRYVSNFDDKTWFATTENVKVKFAFDKKSVLLTPNNGSSSILMHKPLSPKEAIAFRMKFESLGSGWPSINLRMLDKSVDTPFSSESYFIALSGNDIELQKIKDGKTGNERIIFTMPRGDLIPIGEWFDAYILTENTPEGVHIVFKVNDKTVIDYLDTENAVTDIGYFGFKQGKGDPIYEIGAMNMNVN